MSIFRWTVACLLAAAGIGLSSPGSSAAQPSFDCAIAKAPIERLICSSNELAALDGELGHVFFTQQATRDAQTRRAARDEQRQFLRQRLASCPIPSNGSATAGTERCLAELYRRRLADIGAIVRQVPAGGRHEEVFDVPKVGRYAVRVESAVGVALDVVDRMAGPSGQQGEVGKQDGRIDRIFDRGTYKAVMTGPEDGKGTARLYVDAFRDLSGPTPPRLVELKPVDDTLDDLTQRSWWIDVPERRTVFLEAAGRYLADLRLWRDGSQIVDAETVAERIEPVAGRPLQLRRIAATLEPGLYLLTAYGGPGEAWTQQSNEKPFHLRYGIPVLADAARLQQVASAFGFDRFLTPAATNFARLTLDEPAPAALAARNWNAAAPFQTTARRAEIAKDDRKSYADLDIAAPPDGATLLTVEREPGKPYRLETVPSAPSYNFSGDGDYWIEAFGIGGSDDTVDLTSMLTERVTGSGEHIIAENALRLMPGEAWRRRFNLSDPVTLLVNVPMAGDWTVAAEGENVEAESRFEPFGPRPDGDRGPGLQHDGFVWRLESGFYQLTLEPLPEHEGTATVTLLPAGASPAGSTPRQSVFALRAQRLTATAAYRLDSNSVPGVRRGLVLRKLPIDLAQDLPMTLRPGERVAVPVEAPAAGTLDLLDESGAPRNFVLDAAPPKLRASIAAGRHRVDIANSGAAPLPLVLRFHAEALRPEAPLPTLAADRLSALPNRAFGTAEGSAAGHLGIGLASTPIVAAGNLVLGAPSRATLHPGEALAWDFAIDHPGRYAVSALGLGRQFDIRVEDADGWPVAAPIVAGTLEQEFEPGRYRMIVQPQSDEVGVVASLDERRLPVEHDGHGPHVIALGEHIEHEWLEPEAGAERIADQWRFTLPAAADVTVELSDGMLGTLVREATASGGESIVAAIRQPGWNGRLHAGAYRIDVAALSPSNDLPYTIAVDTVQLVAGQSRMVSVPAEIPIAIGGNDLVEIGSSGPTGVRARLYDSDGKLVAVNDDRPDDWNFGIAATLAPGEYRLLVDAASGDAAALPGRPASGSATTRIELRRPEEHEEAPLVLPGNAEIADADVHTWPLAVAAGGLLVIAGNSVDPLGLSLERVDDAAVWRSVGRATGRSAFLAVPLAGADARYRLRIWSSERHGLPIRLTARLVTMPPVAEPQLIAGIAPTAIDGIDPPLFAAVVQPVEPGFLRIAPGIAWSAAPGEPVRQDEVVVAGTSPVWLLARSPETLRAARLEPASGAAPPVIAVSDGARTLSLVGGIMRLAFEPTEPTLLRLRSTSPVIANFVAPDGGRVTDVAADGAHLARYLRAGRNLVELQSTAPGDLSGELELLQIPVVPIGEGLGDKIQLSGGESRLYGFILDGDRTVGVGIRSAVDVATCRLLDAAGKVLGSGVVQIGSLSAGTYLLAVDVPAGAAPVEIQPALVGAQRPDTGPPAEIRLKYLELVGRLPSE
jgi:uncharacterized protein